MVSIHIQQQRPTLDIKLLTSFAMSLGGRGVMYLSLCLDVYITSHTQFEQNKKDLLF